MLQNMSVKLKISRNLVRKGSKLESHVFDLQDTTEEEDKSVNDDEAKKGLDNPALEVDEK